MKHFKFQKVLAILMVVIELSGCATMFGRQQNEQSVFFDANVPDVEVTCSGKRVKTPGSLPLKQSMNHACSAEKQGYQKRSFEIQSGNSWSGFGHSTAVNTALWGWWTWGVGTVLGWLIDLPSGAMKNLKEDHIQIIMETVK